MKTQMCIVSVFVISSIFSKHAISQIPDLQEAAAATIVYCYHDNLNTSCKDVIDYLIIETGTTAAVASCGGCPEPTPEAPNPICPNADKNEAVGDPAIQIVFATPLDPGTGPGKEGVEYHDPAKDCGVLNKCLASCVAVIGGNSVSFRCQKVLFDDNLSVKERTAKGKDCPVLP